MEMTMPEIESARRRLRGLAWTDRHPELPKVLYWGVCSKTDRDSNYDLRHIIGTLDVI